MTSLRMLLSLLFLATAHAQSEDLGEEPAVAPTTDSTICPQDRVIFEMVTGFVYSAPSDMMDSLPGTLKVTDCLDICRSNDTCLSANYETGLCVLFSSSAESYPGSLTPSDFPVFTLYIQKQCLPEPHSCQRAWAFERVLGLRQDQSFTRKVETVPDRQTCQALCMQEEEFVCRSANYNNVTGDCSLSDMDRHTTVSPLTEEEGTDFLENNCVDDPVRLCEFEKQSGRILKTVDSVFQEVETLDECKQLCLEAPYRCHSFDHNDTGDKVCRLSHHTAATLTHITDPYLELPDSSTYQLSSCYNVTIDCRSGDMVARIRTSKLFDGKIYSKGSPNKCVQDVSNSLEFTIALPYNDVECNVKRDSASRYSSDIVIQHHDTIVTSADLGLSVHCQYDLSNKSVSNRVDLSVTGDLTPALQEEMIVDSPNVLMRVADSEGQLVKSAAVGDMLQLRFEVVDKNSPYEILVRDLIAMDGGEGSQLELLDSRGCPMEMAILRPLKKLDNTGKVLGASFDAFKFPSSEVVQFRALVTPCIPFCEPVVCQVSDFSGKTQTHESYGRKRRSALTSDNARENSRQIVHWLTSKHLDVEGFGVPQTQEISLTLRRKRATQSDVPSEHLLVQSIKITDKFGFRGQRQKQSENISESEVLIAETGWCTNGSSYVVGCLLFLVAQLIILVAWGALYRRKNKLEEPLGASHTTQALKQLYDSGYPRRV